MKFKRLLSADKIAFLVYACCFVGVIICYRLGIYSFLETLILVFMIGFLAVSYSLALLLFNIWKLLKLQEDQIK